MKRILILCVEDEQDVLTALIEDLAALEDAFPIESADSAADAREVIERVHQRGDRIGLIFCDHMMAGEKGVELLVHLQSVEKTAASRKVLVTAHAGMEDTIQAVNQAGLNYYISKPWNPDELLDVARKQLSEYILEQEIDPRPYLNMMDSRLLAEAVRQGLFGDR